MRFQADGENLTNVLDVIDFGGLFSGNAIAHRGASLCALHQVFSSEFTKLSYNGR